MAAVAPAGRDVLVDGHAFDVRARFTGVAASMIDPARVVDQHVE
jgi:hypothetical protein